MSVYITTYMWQDKRVYNHITVQRRALQGSISEMREQQARCVRCIGFRCASTHHGLKVARVGPDGLVRDWVHVAVRTLVLVDCTVLSGEAWVARARVVLQRVAADPAVLARV